MLHCIVVDFDSVIRWFFDNTQFASYTFSPNENFPRNATIENEQLNLQVGGVDVQILGAVPNDNNPDAFSFNSSLAANISALQLAGISSISCGGLSPASRSTLNIELNSNACEFASFI